MEDEYEDLKALFQMFDFDQVQPPLLSRTEPGPEDLIGVGDEINSILTKSDKKINPTLTKFYIVCIICW